MPMNQDQEALHKLWEEHIKHEYSTHNTHLWVA